MDNKVRKIFSIKVVFIMPMLILTIALLFVPLYKLVIMSIDNTSIVDGFPNTVKLIKNEELIKSLQKLNDKKIPNIIYKSLAIDLLDETNKNKINIASRRLGDEKPGFQSLITKTYRDLNKLNSNKSIINESNEEIKKIFLNIDTRWADFEYLKIFYKNTNNVTPYYLLNGIDLKQDVFGNITKIPDNERFFGNIYINTFMICFMTVLLTLLIGYPLAYWIVHLPPKYSKLALSIVIMALLTFSMVRLAGWTVLLQNNGLFNTIMVWLHIIEQPIHLLYNRTAIYIVNTHYFLPFMVLPIIVSMKSIPKNYLLASTSLGDSPFKTFLKIYLPYTYSGIYVGSFFVFLNAMGYYVTPSSLGGNKGLMITYYIDYFINKMVNWNQASANAIIVLILVLLLCLIMKVIISKTRKIEE